MQRVGYDLDGQIATITMDDGKANVLSRAMQAEINEAFDRAEADKAVVILTGREGRFSGGFDLQVFAAGGPEAPDMLRGGFELSARMLSFPYPVVVACTGHAIAMGAFLLLSGDYRIGVSGAFKVQAIEVAIGMTMPFTAIEICRQRLTTSHYDRAVLLAETFTPETAVDAGFLDLVVDPSELAAAARERAEVFTQLNLDAHGATKLRAREQSLAAIRAAIEIDDAAVRAMLPVS
jgi:enoyl-CoA hydratase